MERIVNAHRDALDPRVEGEASSRSTTRTSTDRKPLSPRALEDRKLIHRNDSVRSQADAFRGLRTKLLALGQDRDFITLVAPVQPGCGGSFVARHLAAAFAFDDSKTALLADCDPLHPTPPPPPCAPLHPRRLPAPPHRTRPTTAQP